MYLLYGVMVCWLIISILFSFDRAETKRTKAIVWMSFLIIGMLAVKIIMMM